MALIANKNLCLIYMISIPIYAYLANISQVCQIGKIFEFTKKKLRNFIVMNLKSN